MTTQDWLVLTGHMFTLILGIVIGRILERAKWSETIARYRGVLNIILGHHPSEVGHAKSILGREWQIWKGK